MDILTYIPFAKEEGGAEIVYKQVSQRLKKRGHNVTCLRRGANLQPGQFCRKGNTWRISLSAPPTWKSCLRPTQAYQFIVSLFGLYVFLRKNNPVLVNYHFSSIHIILFIILKPIIGYKLVISHHGSDVEKARGLHGRLLPYIVTCADEVTCVSHDLLSKLKCQVPGWSGGKVVSNGINVDFWGHIPSGCERKSDMIVAVGNLKPVKGHFILIEAMKEVLKSRPEARLHIFGEGALYNRYEQLISRLGLEESVFLEGWTEPDKLRCCLHRASLFAHPSLREGFGVAVVEAMASGLPVIASDSGAIPEVTKGSGARLVDSEDPSVWAQKLKDALVDRVWLEEASKKSKKRAAHFSWEAAIDEYEAIFKILMN